MNDHRKLNQNLNANSEEAHSISQNRENTQVPVPDRETDQEALHLDIIPGEGELNEQLKDKQIFGVYRDEEGTDRAIRQLNKLGYRGADINVYTQNEELSRRITEDSQKDVNILSCSDGSDFAGESYQKGDVVLCVRKDAERFGSTGSDREEADTTVEVAQKVAQDKQRG
ncbi:hypothetical protein DSECCO2_171460 [anaerobic digester metagenome]